MDDSKKIVTPSVQHRHGGAARRALQEAAERKDKVNSNVTNNSKIRELKGRRGPEPTRFGDWEKKGIISDF